MDQYIGKLLDNRYELLELIGVGGMARVYKARCHRLNRLVAVKILREDMAQDAEFRRRFHDESQAVAMLSHPNIMAVYDVSRSSEMEYIVMELLDGITLKQYMQKKGNKLNWREALHFATQIVKGLGHAHSRGIIHRDIKPHNVMVLRDGSVKVADFGIARMLSASHSTMTQEALGSVHYISPEQARGSSIDERSDLYSAGVVLYEMITGRLPFEGDTPVSVAIQHINSIPLSPREIDPEIPEALEKITMKAMAPNRDNRYNNADEMLADLEEFRKNPSISFDYELLTVPPVQLEQQAEEEKTQIRPAPGSSRPRDTGRGDGVYRERPRRIVEEEEDDEDTEPRGSGLGSILLAMVAVLSFIGVVGYLLYKTFFAGILAPATTYEVPELVGKTYESVMTDFDLLGKFQVTISSTVPDAENPAGTIIRQDPVGGSMVGESARQISVVVSDGPQQFQMVDLTNMEYREAHLAVERLGLRVLSHEYEHHDAIPYNHVISYTPLEGAVLSPGDGVTLVLSLGPETLEVDMPNLLGLTLEQAEKKMAMRHLEKGNVTHENSDTVPEGQIMDQYPDADTKVKEGTKVNMQISLGPKQPAQQPATEPEPSDEPGEENGITVPSGSSKVSIPLPTADGEIRVTVKMDNEVIYDNEVDAAMNNSVTITVYGRGEKKLYIYYDGALSRTMTVEL